MTRLVFAFAIVLCALGLVACAPNTPLPDGSTTGGGAGMTIAPAPTPSNLPTNEAGERLVARVNGVEITLTQLERAVARTRPDTAADPDALRATVLDTLIEQELIRQAAVELNVTVSDADIQAEVDANRALAGGDAQWQDWLTQNLFTEAEFRTEVAATLLTGRVRDVITANMPAEVVQVNARHILVATQAEADDLLNQINAGADFATLAAAHSADVSTKDQGGDLGWFSSGELLEPTLEAAALEMQPGEIRVVTTRLGYHVLQTLDVSMRPVDPALLPQLQVQRYTLWLQSLLETATIERYFW